MLDWPLTPPKQITLIVSILIAILACLVHWANITAALGSGFSVLLVGYVLLLASIVFRGL